MSLQVWMDRMEEIMVTHPSVDRAMGLHVYNRGDRTVVTPLPALYMCLTGFLVLF